MAARLDLVPVGEWGFFTLPRPMVVAGPCSAETEEQVMETASALAAEGIHMLRAGIWKPRTHPGCFEGIGPEGLKWLRRVKDELGMFVCTEVAGEKHVAECLKAGVDMVWLGARTTVNPFLVQEIADALRGTDIPVLVKNPVNPDIDLWIGALERLNRAGTRKLGVIHRGFTTYEKIQYRNLGFEGLMVESHCNPACALSDAAQQLTPAALGKMLSSLAVRDKDSDDISYREGIDAQRARIDMIDEEILSLLKSRMDASAGIGRYKKEHNISIVQAARWDSLLSDMIEKGGEKGLSEKFVRELFAAIHEASVDVQNRIMEENSPEK